MGAAEQGVVFKVSSIQQGALSLSGLKKFRKFHVPNGTVHSGCTDPNQATTLLVIVLVSRIQKSGTGDNNFDKWIVLSQADPPR